MLEWLTVSINSSLPFNVNSLQLQPLNFFILYINLLNSFLLSLLLLRYFFGCQDNCTCIIVTIVEIITYIVLFHLKRLMKTVKVYSIIIIAASFHIPSKLDRYRSKFEY